MSPARVASGTWWYVAGWSGLLASTLLLASLFNAGVTNGTKGADQRGDGDQGQGSSCVAQFGSYNWRVFSSGRQGPCGLGPDTSTPIPVQQSPVTAALADGDDVRARFLASLRTQGLGALTDPPQKNCVSPHC
jgi:hypothetical protein